MTYTISVYGLFGIATAIDGDHWQVDIDGHTIVIEPTTTASDHLVWEQVEGSPFAGDVQDIGEAIEAAAM